MPVGTDRPILEKATGLRMDPRIARRWTEVRREQGRRRLRILVAVGAVVLAVGLFAGSLYTPIFKVRHLRVNVQGALAASQVAALSGINGHTLMIGVNDSAVQRRLDAVPTLGQAIVATHWPGTVSIRVSVRDPIAVVATGARWSEIDATGRVLTVVPVRPAGLPQLVGTGAPPAVGEWLNGSTGPTAAVARAGSAPLVDLNAAPASESVPTGTAAMLAVVSALPQQFRIAVGSITITSTGASAGIVMTVAAMQRSSGPITVFLGDGSQLARKLTELATILSEADLSGMNAIDVTVPDRPAALTVQRSPDSLSTHAGGSH